MNRFAALLLVVLAAAPVAARAGAPTLVVPEFQPPQATFTPAPYYPPAVRRSGIEGRVVVEAALGADGRVTSVSIAEGAHPQLDTLALAAVARWRLEPARLDGAPVAVRLAVPVRFRLDDAARYRSDVDFGDLEPVAVVGR